MYMYMDNFHTDQVQCSDVFWETVGRASKRRSRRPRIRKDTRLLLEEFYGASNERLARMLHDERFRNMTL